MWMAANEFGADRSDNITEAECAAFFRHAGMENDLQQQVAKLIPQIQQVRTLDGICYFVGFLDRIGAIVSNVCVRSHAQPITGVRSRAMMSINVPIFLSACMRARRRGA